MTYNAEGKRTSLENLAGQVTTTAWDGWSVTFNGENRPVLWTLVNSSTPNSSTPPLVSMSYDRMGRRVTKNDQRFVYDGYLQIANFERASTNSQLTTYNSQLFIWDPTEPVATRPLVWNSSTLQPFNFSTSYYTHDGNKNVSEVIVEAGDTAAHYEYAPFGALTVSRGASAAANPWRFSSEYAEDDTATVYYNYRHYDPVMGRWMSRDPIENLSPYLYCDNDVNKIDELGLVDLLKELSRIEYTKEETQWLLDLLKKHSPEEKLDHQVPQCEKPKEISYGDVKQGDSERFPDKFSRTINRSWLTEKKYTVTVRANNGIGGVSETISISRSTWITVFLNVSYTVVVTEMYREWRCCCWSWGRYPSDGYRPTDCDSWKKEYLTPRIDFELTYTGQVLQGDDRWDISLSGVSLSAGGIGGGVSW